MLILKGYQQRAIDTLDDFLSKARDRQNVTDAYAEALQVQGLPTLAYRDYGFADVPYVCFRIPTGGGKTLLASHAIVTAAKSYLDADFPITLWLVPSNTIRQQTVDALKTPGHPYREKLDFAFNHQVLVLDIDEVTQIRPQDIGQKAIVVVSTLANLRVNDTSGRKVYAYHENFEPHFAKLPPHHSYLERLEKVSEADIQEVGLSAHELGKIKYSFANLLALHRPLLIVDEAHNARTSLTFDTLQRVHPAAIIEFTATPNTSPTNGSNILYHVSAAELKAEEMIKLPIILTEHQNWQDAVRDTVITRNKLAQDAQQDESYIRPIALLQAEAKNGEVTVEVLKAYLTDDLHIEADTIAIATGNQRELDGLNLFDSACPIEYIITIEALKEGWDCSFAYVFCSVKQVSSSKDAEQLLGRVLRMPFARRRVIEDLNRAYAHLATKGFANAAKELTDKLIAMGFEEMEVAAFLRQQTPVGDGQTDIFGGGGEVSKPALASLVIELPTMPELDHLDDDDKRKLAITEDKDNQKVIVRVNGEASEALQQTLIKAAGKKPAQEAIARDLRIHNQSIQAQKSPSERGESFGQLPLLCAYIQDELELIEPETILENGQLNLLDYPAKLNNFRIQETSNSFSIDLDGKEISYHIAQQSEVINLNEDLLDVTEQDLIGWLDRECKQADVMQRDLIKFSALLINDLLQQPNINLTALVRNKYPLLRAVRDLIGLYRKRAQKAGYQQTLFGNEAQVVLTEEFVYRFSPEHYPARPPYYAGRYKFQKHFFPIIEDLKAQGEEYECAKAIDSLPEVKYWIRNLVRRDHASFWLPLAHNRFYPDFICELKDGRMLVVEYKGEAYASNDDSAEKRAVGELWAKSSQGRCLFIMAVEQDGHGRDVRQQVQDLITQN
ncbi:DEAD/DEAH box helicase [Methylomonas koyamae]|uniref:DEAD/DEAH box helicase n=1 Tax=Methylomonas koyamae TaxID=702114 RepID=UPI001128F4AD|nr:DEAD/DEAH box helicase family protein [Methylomonas koyamae]TPQ24786.1 restriction endonuclease subunit R [Methylomonas koyamae]